jgi:hypothetical protein
VKEHPVRDFLVGDQLWRTAIIARQITHVSPLSQFEDWLTSSGKRRRRFQHSSSQLARGNAEINRMDRDTGRRPKLLKSERSGDPCEGEGGKSGGSASELLGQALFYFRLEPVG